jgi:hypothetical protein
MITVLLRLRFSIEIPFFWIVDPISMRNAAKTGTLEGYSFINLIVFLYVKAR